MSPLVKPFAFLLDKAAVPVSTVLDGNRQDVSIALHHGVVPASGATEEPTPFARDSDMTVEVPLIRLAWARSGDKGNLSNIGLIARRPEWLPLLWQCVTPETVKQYFAHLVQGRVERHAVPGIHAINFLLHEALDGGGPGSMRMDPLGKGMGQMLLDLRVKVPSAVAAAL